MLTRQLSKEQMTEIMRVLYDCPTLTVLDTLEFVLIPFYANKATDGDERWKRRYQYNRKLGDWGGLQVSVRPESEVVVRETPEPSGWQAGPEPGGEQEKVL